MQNAVARDYNFSLCAWPLNIFHNSLCSYLLVIVVITDKPLVVTSYVHCVTSECQRPLVLSLARFASFSHRDTSILLVGECSAFLASGSDRTDDRRRKVNCPVFY